MFDVIPRLAIEITKTPPDVIKMGVLLSKSLKIFNIISDI